ncbi:hypothetical protein ACUXZZ_44840 [Streptomyces graminifolii]|uniref:hypothetical protein n=1 Tax=Streptomyces graminifolii TaxID=1266771 RepID=UPI004059CCF2
MRGAQERDPGRAGPVAGSRALPKDRRLLLAPYDGAQRGELTVGGQLLNEGRHAVSFGG